MRSESETTCDEVEVHYFEWINADPSVSIKLGFSDGQEVFISKEVAQLLIASLQSAVSRLESEQYDVEYRVTRR